MNAVSRDSIARIIDNEFCGASWLVCLDAADRILAAIADTHPKDGDVEQAPLVSGGGARSAIAQPLRSPSPSKDIS